MTAFSPAQIGAVESFAGQLGLQAKPAKDGTYSFAFQASGTLTFTPAQDGTRTVVSLARRPARIDARTLETALARAGFDAARGRLLHVGLAADDHLVFMVGVDSADFSLPVLDDCLQQLRAAHDSLR